MAQYLLVDVGNSRISAAIAVEGAIVNSWHHPTRRAYEAAKEIVARAGGGKVVISSVVPHATEILQRVCRQSHLDSYFIGQRERQLLPGFYSSIGMDRVAGAIAAVRLYADAGSCRQPVAVIDAGTATTLTSLSADGAFAGGYITLGLESALEALAGKTGQLPRLAMEELTSACLDPAFETAASMIAGVVSAQIATVERWLVTSRRRLGQPTLAVLTGGWSRLIAQHTGCVDIVDPHLTLKGLYLIAAEAEDQEDRD